MKNRMRAAFYLTAILVLTACSNSPELVSVGKDRYPAFLSVSYGEFLLQIVDDGVDSAWALVEGKSSITINGKLYVISKARRQKYITNQGGFAYVLNLDAPRFDVGDYRLVATITNGQIEREYVSRYILKHEFVSVFQYLYAIYEQRQEFKREK